MSLNQGNNPENNGEKGDGRKPFRFNIYWLYALIAAVLIGFNLFKGITPSTVETSQTVFEDSMLLRGYVKELQVIRNDGIVRLTIRQLQKNSAKMLNSTKTKDHTFSSLLPM